MKKGQKVKWEINGKKGTGIYVGKKDNDIDDFVVIRDDGMGWRLDSYPKREYLIDLPIGTEGCYYVNKIEPIMNYNERFNKIVEMIGDRNEIKGIDRIYRSLTDYFSITAMRIDFSRSFDKSLFTMEYHFDGSSDKELIYMSEKIEKWFRYVEEKVGVGIKEDMIDIDGRKVSKNTIKEALKQYFE